MNIENAETLGRQIEGTRQSLARSWSALPDTLTSGVISMARLVRRHPVPAALGFAALVLVVARLARRN